MLYKDVRSFSFCSTQEKNLKNPTTVTLFDYLTSTYLFIFLLYLINDFIFFLTAVQHERGPRSSTLRKQRQDKLMQQQQRHQQQQQQRRQHSHNKQQQQPQPQYHHILPPYHSPKCERLVPSPSFQPILDDDFIERLLIATDKCLVPGFEEV